MTQQLWQHDAYSLSGLLAAGQITPVQLLEHIRSRIDALNGIVNAVVCTSDEAMSEAHESGQRRAAGMPLSPLDGVPILIKDNMVVRGIPATWGSKLYQHKVAMHDELPVELLRGAGAIIVGKTNCPEFTVEGFTANELFGVTPNPWNLSMTPGGSSGGSVAAVAAGMVPIALGTDGGGSIRRPAAYTNLVGLKPSIGRIPRGAGLPQLLLDMEVVGPVTRSVRDQALLFDVLARPDARDHRSLRFKAADSLGQLFQEPPPLKILAVETFEDAPLDPDIRDSFRQMVKLLESLGHEVERAELPLDIRRINEYWASIAQVGLAALLEREPEMRRLASAKYVEWGDTRHDATHLLKVSEAITELRNEAAQVFSKLDIIMTPTCAAMPWSTGIPFPPEIDGQPVGPRGSAVYTGWVNACGHPAISVPGHPGAGSMPIGVQFVADFARDELALRLAQQIESRQGWRDRWPDVAFSDGH